MFQLLTASHQNTLARLIIKAHRISVLEIAADLEKLIAQIRADIPEKKRVSYGRYSIIKKLGLALYPLLKEKGIDVFNLACEIFMKPELDQFVRSLAVQLISICGLEKEQLTRVLHIFEKAAADENWELRECSAGFVRKLVKKYPERMKKWYLAQVKSQNPLQRRFASESLRPVADNRWFKKYPDFTFS